MIRTCLVALCALTLAACGRKHADDPGNRAAAATFAYGAPTAASASQAAAVEGTVTESSSFAASADAGAGLGLSDPTALVEALLGGHGFSVQAQVPASSVEVLSVGAARPGTALVGSGVDDPACVARTDTSVTFTRCTVTLDLTVDGAVVHAVVGVDGSASWTPATGTLAWDVDYTESFSVTGNVAYTGTGALHMAGELELTATTLVGHMGSELAVTQSMNGQTMRVGVDEAADVDVTYAAAAVCPTRVTGGTLEAKRVWTARPGRLTAAELPDRAAKVTWTGCGEATVQYGTR